MADVVALPSRFRAGSRSGADAIDLSVVIPAYNEAARLPDALWRLAAWIAALPWRIEVVVVDDGSADGTAEGAAVHPCGCGVIRLRHNSGKGAAVRTGMLAARGRVVAFTDADLPYRMDALERAFATIDRGDADAVFGGRDLDGSSMAVRRAAHRTLASTAFRLTTRLLVSRQVRDTQCGLKAMRRDVGQLVFSKMQVDGFAFDVELFHLVERYRLTLTEVPVEVVNSERSTVHVARDAWRLLRDLFRIRSRAGHGDYEADLSVLPAAAHGAA